ncbi:MAG: hypothetical protein QOF41_2252 [Methylobacteriaceae bacterium]|nr:hypothetical protein [Methylobacteriaceae bacterium]
MASSSMFGTFANLEVKVGKRRSQVKLIERSGVFFAEWYVGQLRDSLPLGMKASEHYLLFGFRHGLNPNPIFSSEYYDYLYPAAKSEEENPLLHFLIHGHSRRYNPHWLFDTDWYLRENPDVADTGQNALAHYLQYGAAERRDPSPLFDTRFYLSQINHAGGLENCLIHFLETGASKRLKPNRAFDPALYLQRYPDVAQARIDPLLHYLSAGAREGRDPGAMFQSDWYLDKYPDVRAAQINPLVHFLRDGAAEGRQPCDPDVVLAGMRIAVVVHVFYREMWRQIVQYLKNIPLPYELFVTVTEGADALTFAGIRRTHPGANIVVVPNRGWDIAPFFRVFSGERLSERFDVVCKLHTKKGRTYPDLWRKMMLDSTLGNRLMVTELLLEFRREPELILAGADEFFISGPKFIGPNGPMVAAVAERYKPGTNLPSEWGFFAGTMFWMRPQAYERLAQIVEAIGALDDERKSNDGEFAHAVERAFGLVAALDLKRVAQVKIHKTAGLDYTLQTQDAPGRPGHQELAQFLGARAKEMPPAPSTNGFSVPLARKKPRDWKAPEGSEPGLNVVGPLPFLNGLGILMRAYARTFQAAGVKMFLLPWTQGFDRLTRVPFEGTGEPDQQPANFVHLNLDLLNAGRFVEHEPLSSLMGPERYNILSFAWELLSIPAAWAEIIEAFDEVWVSSSFIARAVAAVSRRRVRVIRPAIDFHTLDCASADRTRFDLPSDEFIFFYSLDAGSVLGRKNPQAFVRAFCDAFAEKDGAMCLLKIHSLDPDDLFAVELRQIMDERKDVRVMGELLKQEELATLYHSVDCYVSPHRSEGLGLTIIEAMAVGKPVIATPFGGVMDFVNAKTAFPLPYKLTEIGDGNAPYPATYTWADPDVGALKEKMLHVFSHRADACDVGLRGSRAVRAFYSVEGAAAEVTSALREIWGKCQGSTIVAPSRYDYLEAV